MRPCLFAALVFAMLPSAIPAQDQERPLRLYTGGCRAPGTCPTGDSVVWRRGNALPEYRRVFRDVGIEGESRVRFEVLPDGSVRESTIVATATGGKGFAVIAREAVAGWRFDPVPSGIPAGLRRVEVRFVFGLLPVQCSDRFEDIDHVVFGVDDSAPVIMILRCHIEPHTPLQPTRPS